MLALDSDVRPTSVPSPVAPLNTYTLSELCVETFGGLGSTLVELINEAAAMRGNKLTHGEYEAEATWSTRKFRGEGVEREAVLGWWGVAACVASAGVPARCGGPWARLGACCVGAVARVRRFRPEKFCLGTFGA